MTMTIVNLPACLADELLAQAADPVAFPPSRAQSVALPFHMDVVNSFEEAVDIWQPETCPIFVMKLADDASPAWAEGVAHSGSRSIRISGTGGRQEFYPDGAPCMVEPHRRYRLEGWIRTRGVERFARLELESFEYTQSNVIERALSAPVCGESEWTRVDVVLDSGDEAYVLPRLVLYGPGTAWFDDLRLSPA